MSFKKLYSFLNAAYTFKYLLVGIVGILIDFFFTISIYQINNNLLISNIYGYSLGSIITYIGHSKFTFIDRSSSIFSFRQLTLFLLSLLIGSFVGYIILKFLIYLSFGLKISKIFQLLAIGLSQYFFNRTITFNKLKKLK